MNLFGSSKFDYHLQPNEQEQVERLVPYNQAKIHLAFRANVSYSEFNSNSQKDFNGAAVALSEHMVTICVHGFFGRSYKLLEAFHMNDITKLRLMSDELTIIETIKGVYSIDSPASLKFARNVVRNYILSNPMMPPSLRFVFKAEDPSQFPKFNPPLSPSQQFQFSYNANCSYFNVTYYHDIPRYFHNLISSGSCIFDFTQLPIHLMECGLGQSTDIRPITSALMFDPYIYGINISDITRDDIITASASIILMSPSLRIVRLIKTGAQKGGMMVSNAMNQSLYQNVSYWDLSGNHLEDVVYIADSLGRYKGQLITLRLNNCKMTNSEVTTLLSSLTDNENNHKVKQLALIGNGFNQTNCDEFCNFLRAITFISESSENLDNLDNQEKELENIDPQKKDDPTVELIRKNSSGSNASPRASSIVDESCLYHLEIGPVKNPASIVQTINDCLIPLRTFKLVDSSFDENAVRLFSNFLNSSVTLKELDISGSSIKDQQLELLLGSLLSNACVEEGSLTLTLNRLNLRGNRYNSIKSTLIEYQSKIKELSLDENGLTMNDSVINDIGRFQNLRKVSLAVNFTKKMAGVGSALSTILQHSNIVSLNISGNCSTGQIVGGYALENEAIGFIRSLYTNSSLECLDISGNLIGDEGVKMISEVIRENAHLKIVNIDNNAVTNLGTINEFLDSVAQSSSMIDAVFPVDDIYDILSGADDEEKLKNDLECLSKKRQIAQKVTMTNMSRAGIYSALSLLNDKTLDDLVDESTLELQEKLDSEKVELEKHAAITKIVGLPLPYEEDAGETKADVNEAEEGDDDVYASKAMMSTIYEPENESFSTLSSFKTLQFNSLCIRRPDAEQKLEEKGKFLLQSVDVNNILPPQQFASDNNNNENDDENPENNDKGNGDLNDAILPSKNLPSPSKMTDL